MLRLMKKGPTHLWKELMMTTKMKMRERINPTMALVRVRSLLRYYPRNKSIL